MRWAELLAPSRRPDVVDTVSPEVAAAVDGSSIVWFFFSLDEVCAAVIETCWRNSFEVLQGLRRTTAQQEKTNT